MRVLHVVPGLAARTGGVASALVELCLGLESCGVETTIISTDIAATSTARTRAPVKADELPPGADRLDVRLYPVRPPFRLSYSPALARALRHEVRRYDVVHVHSLWLHPTFAGCRAARRANVPYVVCPQGMLDPGLRSGRQRKALTNLAWQGRALAGASAIHFTAQDELRLAAGVASGVPRVVIANPIDWDSYGRLPSAADFRARFLGGHQGPLILNHGRLARKKGIDVLLESFALVLQDVPDAQLAVVGPDDEGLLPELRELARKLGVEQRTTFTGMLYGDDRLGALGAADVWALPSRQDAWASAVTEALASGLPVIITPEVNSAPDLEEAGAGIVRQRTPAAFAETISELLLDQEARSRLGASARAFAHRCDRSVIGLEAARMYETALAARPARRPRAVTADA